MKECQDVQAALSAYLDGEVGLDERETIEQHIAGCPACAAELASLRRLVDACRQMDEVEVPGDLRQAVMQRVRGREQARRKRGLFPAAVAVAAVLVVAIGVGSGLGTNLWTQLTSGLKATAPGGEAGLRAALPAPTPAPAAPAPSKAGSEGVFQSADYATLPQPVPPPTAAAGASINRMVIRRADLGIEVPKGGLLESGRRAEGFVEAAGGYVQRSSTYEEEAGRKVIGITARVPEDAFTHLVNQFDGLGVVKHRNIDAEDITERYIDLQAYVRNREVQERRLLEILELAKSVSEIMQVENELVRVRSDIDSNKGRLRYYENAVAMSTVNLTLREEGSPAVGPKPVGLWAEIVRAFESSLRTLALVLAAALPYLLIAALVGLAYLGWVRRQRD
jgi:anti-sigma factor (TIGR02949 family)